MIVIGNDNLSSIIKEALASVEDNQSKLNDESKYKIGQRVRVSSDLQAIINLLTPTYTPREAKNIAKVELCDQIVTILSIEMLVDSDNQLKKFYTVETEEGYMHCLPEYLIVESK